MPRPPRPRRPAPPPEPAWPDDVDVDLPRAVRKQLSQQAPSGVADRVMLALTLGSAAIDEGEPEVAVRYLEWAKHHAPRSATIREALGVAHYLTDDFDAATTELQAYRRMTGAQDQNHVLADCWRAQGRGTGDIGELVQQMAADRDGAERLAEGIIVWASALADAGDVGAGRAVLRRLLDDDAVPLPARIRLWYVAGDLAERDGAQGDAVAWFRKVVSADDEDEYDGAERLAALRDG